MPVYQKIIENRVFWITVDPVFVQHTAQGGFTHGGFVARISSDVAPAEEVPEGFIPYVGELIKDGNQRTILFPSEDAARDAAANEITRRLERA